MSNRMGQAQGANAHPIGRSIQIFPTSSAMFPEHAIAARLNSNQHPQSRLAPEKGKTMNPTPTRFKSPDGQKLAYVKWAKDWRIVHIDPEMRDRKSFDIISAAIEKAE
jgi:hypothetical protein